jgi:hypothetical protein
MAPDQGVDAKLDELLGEVDASPQPVLRHWLVRASFQTLAASAVFYTVARAVGVAPSFPLVFAVAAGAALIRVATGQLREPRRRRTGDIVRGDPGDLAGPEPARADGMLAAVRRWDRRLAPGRAGADRELRPALRELAEERLRQRYGLSLADDPERARRLLGEPLWSVLTGAAGSPSDVDAAVRRLESLSDWKEGAA